MDILKAIVLGAIQGVTEWLPISSTAHLRVVPNLLGWQDPGAAATAVMQLGTTLAVLTYFRAKLAAILRGTFAALRSPEGRRSPEARLGVGVLLGTLPIMIGAVLFKDLITGPLRNLNVIAWAFIIGGIALYAAEQWAVRRDTTRRVSGSQAADAAVPLPEVPLDVSLRNSIITGIAQAFALIPGVSRSGATLTGAFLSGLNKATAVEFSFLLSIPATLIAGLYELKDVIKPEPLAPGSPPPMEWSALNLGIATLVAFGVGYATIAWLLKYLAKHSTLVFVVYRIVLGIVLLTLVARGTLQAL